MLRTIMNIIESIHQQCDELGLLYDPLHSPIKIGPDCYMFMAVRKTEECKSQGRCKQERFYALTGGRYVIITQ